MEKTGITMGKFIAGIVIAILVSSAVSVGISTLLIKGSQGPEGPQGEKGETGATGATGPQGPYLPDYDSGWIDITNNAGQFIDITHNLNSEDIIVDIRGKTTASDGANQRYLGLRGNIPGWTKTYGGMFEDAAFSLVQTADGGYALAGYGYSSVTNSADFWLVKTYANGTMQWNKTYGGTDPDRAYSMVQTADGGYALAGYTNSYGAGGGDFWLVKTDSAGNQLWTKTYGGTDDDIAYSVVQTSDGGYALAGETYSYDAGGADFWLVKTDSAGNQEWVRTYGGANADVAYSVVQTSDSGYALAGYTLAAGWDAMLVKTNSTGDQQWIRTYGGSNDDATYSVVQTADGGYALAGYTSSYGVGTPTYPNFWLVKTYANGTMQWNKTYGGAGSDSAWSVVQTADGGYALAGYTSSYGAGAADFWLVKTDSAGNQLWTKTYGGTGADIFRSVVQTSDGGYALAGYTSSYGAGGVDFWLVKTDLEGEFGLAWTDSTANTITLYRGRNDVDWNYVQVRVWKID